MTLIPRILPSGSVLVPEAIEENGLIGDTFVEVKPGDEFYDELYAEAKRLAPFAAIEDALEEE